MKLPKFETFIGAGLISSVLVVFVQLYTVQAHAAEFTQDIKVLCIQMNKASKAHDYILESKLISRIEGITKQEVTEVCGE